MQKPRCKRRKEETRNVKRKAQEKARRRRIIRTWMEQQHEALVRTGQIRGTQEQTREQRLAGFPQMKVPFHFQRGGPEAMSYAQSYNSGFQNEDFANQT